jgi:hypothetical protein
MSFFRRILKDVSQNLKALSIPHKGLSSEIKWFEDTTGISENRFNHFHLSSINFDVSKKKKFVGRTN